MTVTQLKLTLSEEYQHLKRQNQLDDTAYAASLSCTKKKKGVCSVAEEELSSDEELAKSFTTYVQ